MKPNNIAVAALTLAVLSCGPSKEQIQAREQLIADSVAKATETSIARQQAIQDSITQDTYNQELLQAQLIELKSQLAGEESKLQNAEQFKLLRTPQEKADEIAAQTRIIEELKAQIQMIEKQIK